MDRFSGELLAGTALPLRGVCGGDGVVSSVSLDDEATPFEGKSLLAEGWEGVDSNRRRLVGVSGKEAAVSSSSSSSSAA